MLSKIFQIVLFEMKINKNQKTNKFNWKKSQFKLFSLLYEYLS